MLSALLLKLGLYRDDGLAVCDATPRETEKIKKHICKIFKDNGLSITIEANKHAINFLDVTFNLPEGRYSPYTKPNTTLLYMNQESNHPPQLLRTFQQESIDDSPQYHRTASLSRKLHPPTKECWMQAATTTPSNLSP